MSSKETIRQSASSAGHTRTMITAAMFAALTLLATSVLRIQTPAFGYIHLGDAFVLLSGFFLGPFWGGLAAGTGSALSDLLGGYVIWAPGTFIIKFLTALSASAVCSALRKQTGGKSVPVIAGGAAGELVMVIGYFFFDILVITFSNGGASVSGTASAVSLAIAGLPFNIAQGVTGVLLSLLFSPVFAQIRMNR